VSDPAGSTVVRLRRSYPLQPSNEPPPVDARILHGPFRGLTWLQLREMVDAQRRLLAIVAPIRRAHFDWRMTQL